MKALLKKAAICPLAVCLTIAVLLASCSRPNAAKPETPALTQEQIDAEVARQVAEQLAAASQSAVQPVTETTQASPVWKPGIPGPNGGLVYYAQDGEYYEAIAPGNTVGMNESLPTGWSTPDMEDLGLIYQGLQKTGAADYGDVYYISVSKTAGKNRFLKMSDGTEAAGLTAGRIVGVRKFDPGQSPAVIAAAALVYTPAAAITQAPSSAAPAPSPAQAGSSARTYAIGDTGPGGGIVFSASGGKYKEITKPENAGGVGAAPPAGWKLASMPELMQIYTSLRGKADFGDFWYRSSSTRHRLPNGYDGTDYTRDHAALTPGSMSDYDKARIFFPDAQFILAFGGGPPTEYFIRFTDGKIIGGYTEDGSYWSADYGSGAVLNDAKCLYVREF
jgi:hypothetical protein